MLFVALISFSTLFAESQAANPTRLRAVSRVGEIGLSWEATQDPPGGWAVYRSSLAFGNDSFGKAARIAIVPPAGRDYTVKDSVQIPAFYAVLGLAQDGSPTASFVAGKSVTAVAVAGETVLASGGATSGTTQPATPPAPTLSSIVAISGLSLSSSAD